MAKKQLFFAFIASPYQSHIAKAFSIHSLHFLALHRDPHNLFPEKESMRLQGVEQDSITNRINKYAENESKRIGSYENVKRYIELRCWPNNLG